MYTASVTGYEGLLHRVEDELRLEVEALVVVSQNIGKWKIKWKP